MRKIMCAMIAAALSATLCTTPAAANDVRPPVVYLDDAYVLKHGPTTQEEAEACESRHEGPRSNGWVFEADCSVLVNTEEQYQEALNRKNVYLQSPIGKFEAFFLWLSSLFDPLFNLSSTSS